MTMVLAVSGIIAAISTDWTLALILGGGALLAGFQCVQLSRIRKGGQPVSERVHTFLVPVTLVMFTLMLVYLFA